MFCETCKLLSRASQKPKAIKKTSHLPQLSAWLDTHELLFKVFFRRIVERFIFLAARISVSQNLYREKIHKEN